MGGQACVLYGAAEFSRDTDFAILASPDNLSLLRTALAELAAEVVAVPPFAAEYLERGHAIHFRCLHPDAEGMRVDVMSKLRGVDDFAAIWERRTTVEAGDGERHEVMSLPDLVQAKKTQRDKDWPMLRRLVEASYLDHRSSPTDQQLSFWLQELRTSELLLELVQKHPSKTCSEVGKRSLLTLALAGEEEGLVEALAKEELAERAADRAYWLPLKRELEQLRHARLG
jgi:hypothetical protein